MIDPVAAGERRHSLVRAQLHRGCFPAPGCPVRRGSGRQAAFSSL